ncbi:hypothetical protein A8112_23795, partial [Escherichia coli]
IYISNIVVPTIFIMNINTSHNNIERSKNHSSQLNLSTAIKKNNKTETKNKHFLYIMMRASHFLIKIKFS